MYHSFMCLFGHLRDGLLCSSAPLSSDSLACEGLWLDSGRNLAALTADVRRQARWPEFWASATNVWAAAGNRLYFGSKRPRCASKPKGGGFVAAFLGGVVGPISSSGLNLGCRCPKPWLAGSFCNWRLPSVERACCSDDLFLRFAHTSQPLGAACPWVGQNKN